MGIRYADCILDGGRRQVIGLYDSVSGKPLPGLPYFEDIAHADGLIRFARERGYGDLRAYVEEELGDLYNAWLDAGSPAETEEDDLEDDEEEEELEDEPTLADAVVGEVTR